MVHIRPTTTVTIHPFHTEAGRQQFEAVVTAIMDADAGVDHEFDMDVFGVYARAALDALREPYVHSSEVVQGHLRYSTARP